LDIPSFAFDGNWVDVGSIVTGAVYIGLQRFRRATPVRLISKETGTDFANGTALFPLLVLTVCPLSTGLVNGLVEASKMTLAVAGFFALLAVLEE
jgi:hypothetical protein